MIIVPFYKIRDRQIHEGNCLCGYNKIEDGRCVRCGVPIIPSFRELIVDVDILGKKIPYMDFLQKKDEIEKEIEWRAFEKLCKDLRIPVPAPIPDEEIEEEMKKPLPEAVVEVKAYRVVEDDAEMSKGRVFVQKEIHYYTEADLVTFNAVFYEVLAEKGWSEYLIGHKFFIPYEAYFRHIAKRRIVKVEFEVEERDSKEKSWSWKFLGKYIPNNLYLKIKKDRCKCNSPVEKTIIFGGNSSKICGNCGGNIK